MTKVETRRHSLLGTVASFATFGLAVGALGISGWRSAAPYGDLEFAPVPPELRPPSTSEPGFMVVFDHFVYVSGPAWMPMALLLPMLGAVVGALVGAFASLCGLQWIRNRRSSGWLAIPFICVTGILVGLVIAAASAIYPPTLLVAMSSTPSADPYAIEGAPLHVDWAPIYLTFPAIGLVVGAIVAVIVNLLGVRLSRTTVVEDDHNGNESPIGFHP